MMIGGLGLYPFRFWNNFRYQNSQAIDTELSKPNPSLLNLLREEDIVQEIKSGSNQKLQKFLALHLNELLQYVVTMPPEDTHERGHKLPFVVNQILSQDCGPILDSFFEPVVVEKKQDSSQEKEESKDFQNDELLGVSHEEEFVHDFQEQEEHGPFIVKSQQDDTDDGQHPPPLETNQKQETDQEIKTEDIEVQYNLPSDNEPEQEEEEEQEEGQIEKVYDYEDDEEEKEVGMSAFESTTVETKAPSKYENLKKVFDFLLPQRPQSSASSQDTNDTFNQENNEDELNPVLCGYFTRILNNLINRRPKLLFQFFTERPDVIHRMTKHLYSTAITEALTRILLCENHGLQETELIDEYNDMRDQIVKEILLELTPNNQTWTYKNIATIVNDLASRKNFMYLLTSPPLMHILLSSLLIKDQNLEKEKVSFLRKECLRILSSLLNKYRENLQRELSADSKEDKKEEKDEKQFAPVEDDAVLIGAEEDEEVKNEEPKTIITSSEPSPLIEALYEHFETLVELLNLESEITINSITGQAQKSFGGVRLYVVDILASLVILNEPGINCKISESGVLKKLLQFYGSYEWNNLLHFKLGVIFSTILQNYSFNGELLHSLFIQANFINYITSLISCDDFVLKNGTARKIERGFYPYLVRFMVEIEKYRAKSSFIDDQIKAFGEEEWTEVWQLKIEPKETKYAKQLGGYHPSHPKPEKQSQKQESEKKEESDQVSELAEEQDDRFSSFKKNNDLLKSIDDSSKRHSSLFLNHENEEQEEEDDIFEAWNVDDPERVLEEQKEKERYESKQTEINNDFSGLNEEFFDAQDSLEEKAKQEEDEDYNDYNFWKLDLSGNYNLDRLMQEM